MHSKDGNQVDLHRLARQSMLAHGFQPDFGRAVLEQLAELKAHPPSLISDNGVRDLRHLLWSSIDNDSSRDLDQIEVVERLSSGDVRVLVGIADVDAFVPKHSAIDQHAAQQTTTVYTGVETFSMLPEQLSTGASSLLEVDDKLSFVTELVIDANGGVVSSDLYRALVRNQAQLTYSALGAWLEARAEAPEKVAASPGLQDQLKLQDQVAQTLKTERHRQGALNIDTIEVQAVVANHEVVDIARQSKNRATELIEEFMIAVNGAVARRLEERKISCIRRVVRSPERWDRIVQLAAQQGEQLPSQPDSKALNEFLTRSKAADPDHFPDLSLAVIKLMGPGQYVLQRAGDASTGHFGLAVQDYTHSTAPNRRFADLITQRLIRAMLEKRPTPYTDEELSAIASICTEKENTARKVEREMSKRISAVVMSDRVGESFDAIVTGVNVHGTFVRVLQPHLEGLLQRGQQGLDVGDRIRVTLIKTDVERGYIDFARANT
jgi:VacB/RNase II family 3'-5' exoribonuclease